MLHTCLAAHRQPEATARSATCLPVQLRLDAGAGHVFFRRTPHLIRRSSSHQQLSASPTLDLRKPGSHSRHGCRSVIRPRCYCAGSAVPVVPGLQIIPGQIWPVHLSAAQCCTRFIDGRCVQATCALPTASKANVLPVGSSSSEKARACFLAHPICSEMSPR